VHVQGVNLTKSQKFGMFLLYGTRSLPVGMGDADEFGLLAERYAGPLVLEPDHARGPQARYADAKKFIEENAATRIDRAFWHEIKAAPSLATWYHDTVQDGHLIEAPQARALCPRSSQVIECRKRKIVFSATFGLQQNAFDVTLGCYA
jgi:hypothetical protein